jgi:hypothetical protein
MIRSKRVMWVGQASPMKEVRNVYKILAGKLQGKDHFGD